MSGDLDETHDPARRSWVEGAAASGCNLRPGDLLGAGTISAPTGETRSFLEDGDEIVFTARAQAEGFAPLGFGECRGVVVAALPG